jgi:putative Holliday junction resolvase
MNSQTLVSLDVGEKRIGVATADDAIKIAIPHSTVLVDGTELEAIAQIVLDQKASVLVVGYPRNQKGEATAQTRYVEKFTQKLSSLDAKVVFQDESLTSVMAEQRLINQKKPYTKADIDAQAATIILQDYLQEQYGY